MPGGAFIGFGGYRRHFEQRRIGFHGDAVPGGGHGARQIHGQLNIGARLGGVRARHCDTGYRLLDRRNGRTVSPTVNRIAGTNGDALTISQ